MASAPPGTGAPVKIRAASPAARGDPILARRESAGSPATSPRRRPGCRRPAPRSRPSRCWRGPVRRSAATTSEAAMRPRASSSATRSLSPMRRARSRRYAAPAPPGSGRTNGTARARVRLCSSPDGRNSRPHDQGGGRFRHRPRIFRSDAREAANRVPGLLRLQSRESVGRSGPDASVSPPAASSRTERGTFLLCVDVSSAGRRHSDSRANRTHGVHLDQAIRPSNRLTKQDHLTGRSRGRTISIEPTKTFRDGGVTVNGRVWARGEDAAAGSCAQAAGLRAMEGER